MDYFILIWIGFLALLAMAPRETAEIALTAVWGIAILAAVWTGITALWRVLAS
jgi:hypothetical protein